MTIPLYIMHVNLWAPGISLSNNSAGHHLLNLMCDLTQFFVSDITMETYVEHLSKLFMDNFVLLFGTFTILVANSKSGFNSIFKYMCAALGIIYWPLLYGNHKNASIEKFHCFLYKTQETASQDRGMHDVFLHNFKTS